MRRLVLIPLLVVTLVIAGGVALVLTTKPDLDHGRDRVDRHWDALRSPLAPRYDQLGGVVEALRDAGAGDRAVTRDLQAELARWMSFVLRPGDSGDEAETANALEGLAARARANVAALPRLQADPDVLEAFSLFDTAVVAPGTIRAYNRSARAYEDERDGIKASIVATLLGYGSRPVFVIPRTVA